MKLFFDENIGKGVPQAFHALKVASVEFPGGDQRRNPRGTQDPDLLRYAGLGRFLFITKDYKILDVEAERRAFVEHSVGGVFLDSEDATKLNMLLVLLKRWEWLNQIDANEPRPFAFRLTMRNRVSRLLL